MKVKEKTKKK